MIHRINVIRCEDTRRRSSGAPSRPEMYDDHLIAWKAHRYAILSEGRQAPAPKRPEPDPEPAVIETIRRLRPTTSIAALAALLGTNAARVSRLCARHGIRADLRGANVKSRPIVSDRDERWASADEAGKALGLKPDTVRKCAALGYRACGRYVYYGDAPAGRREAERSAAMLA